MLIRCFETVLKNCEKISMVTAKDGLITPYDTFLKLDAYNFGYAKCFHFVFIMNFIASLNFETNYTRYYLYLSSINLNGDL